jgi:hypothetical protein
LPFIEIASKTSTYKAFCVHNNCYLCEKLLSFDADDASSRQQKKTCVVL